jgi:hypothetical protein
MFETLISIGRRCSKAGSATFRPVRGSTSAGKFAGPYPPDGYASAGVIVGVSVGSGVGVSVRVAVSVIVAVGVGLAVGAGPQADETIKSNPSTNKHFFITWILF